MATSSIFRATVTLSTIAHVVESVLPQERHAPLQSDGNNFVDVVVDVVVVVVVVVVDVVAIDVVVVVVVGLRDKDVRRRRDVSVSNCPPKKS